MEKPIYAFYLGDYDPSGFGIEEELRDKLTRYSGRRPYWKRLGVVAADFEAFDLIPLPVKASARSAGFAAKYGNRCAEVDALPPNELRERVRDAIGAHIDQDRWQKLQRVEELEQQTLLNLVDGWQKTNLGTLSDTDDEGGDE